MKTQYFDDLRILKEFTISKYVSICLKIIIDPNTKEKMIDIRYYKTFNGVTLPSKKGVWMKWNDFDNYFMDTLVSLKTDTLDISKQIENNYKVIDHNDIAV